MVSKSELRLLNERALQTTEPPSYDSKDEVRVTGEALAQPVFWTGRQWAVTKFGIEARDGKYPIAGSRAWEDSNGHGWLEHMAEKDWVDIHDFTEALRLARARWPKTTN
jgi:hypothetical protein